MQKRSAGCSIRGTPAAGIGAGGAIGEPPMMISCRRSRPATVNNISYEVFDVQFARYQMAWPADLLARATLQSTLEAQGAGVLELGCVVIAGVRTLSEGGVPPLAPARFENSPGMWS